MVVAVKEGERLLLEEQETGIQQLEVLGEVVQLVTVSTKAQFGQKQRSTHVVEDNHGLSPAAISIADGKEETLANNSGKHLLDEESEEDAGNGGQVKVVDQEERPKLEGLAAAHVLSATKDDGIVDDDEDARFLQGRHGSLTGLEAEVIGRVANNLLKGLVEDGPEVDAEWPVQRWDRQLVENRSHCEDKTRLNLS